MAADPIRGKTIRWSYGDGPTKGMTFEHVFGTDGHVSWRRVDQASGRGGESGEKQEASTYEVAEVATDVWAVSYLAPSGWTLTTILDSVSRKIVSVASNEKQLVVQRGTYEMVTPARR